LEKNFSAANDTICQGRCAWLDSASMPKKIARAKTRKSVSKRFKLTASGKVLRQHTSRRHLLSTKNSKKKRQLAKAGQVDKTDLARIKGNLPFS
jgi:large subunit ribosomal protein L35